MPPSPPPPSLFQKQYYNYSAPGFSSKTGHFTQVIWKGSTQLGCAVRECPNGMTAGASSSLKPAFLVVCRYAPAGNYLGQFAANVLPLAPASPSPSPSPGSQNVTSVPCPNCNYTNTLAQHNAYRGLHATPALTYSATLASAADAYASKCAFAHDGTTNDGENLYFAAGSGLTADVALAAATKGWYEEIKVRGNAR